MAQTYHKTRAAMKEGARLRSKGVVRVGTISRRTLATSLGLAMFHSLAITFPVLSAVWPPPALVDNGRSSGNGMLDEWPVTNPKSLSWTSRTVTEGTDDLPMTWSSPEPPDDPPGPDTGDIRPILQSYLDHHRLTLLRICAGLTAEQLVLQPVPPSTLSLLGLVRHMTKVERIWLRIRTAGENIAPLFPDSDEDFDDLDPATAENAIAALPAEWAACDAAVAQLPLEHCFEVDGQEVSLASVYIHLVEEWARHDGHADLIRQVIDGTTGR